jgi:hypothetical protein
MVLSSMDMMQLNNIWMVQFPKDFYFLIQHLKSRCRESFHLYDLDSKLLLISAIGFVDSAAVSCSYLI